MKEIGQQQIDETSAAIVDTTAQPFLVLDERFQVEFANQAFLGAFRVCREETLGSQLFELGNGQWDIRELRELLSEVVPKQNVVHGYRVEHEFESIGRRVMMVNARHLKDGQSRRERILIAIDDVTEKEVLEKELRGRAEFSEKLIESLAEMVLVLRSDLTVESANHTFHEMFRTTPEEIAGIPVRRLGNGRWDDPVLRRMLEEVLPEQRTFDAYELDCDFGYPGHRIMLVNGRQLDHMPLILLTMRDVTDERLNLARQAAIVDEMQHRVKNIFTNIIAVARLSSKYAETMQEFIESFEERLRSLSRTNDLMVDGPTKGARIGKIVRSELGALGAKEGQQFTLEGPAIRLPSAQTHAFAMAVHELSTNALKYGALKSGVGRVSVTWRQLKAGSQTMAEFVWRETGARLASPDEPGTGFGSEMLNNIVPYMLRGEASMDFAQDGLSYKLSFPVGLE